MHPVHNEANVSSNHGARLHPLASPQLNFSEEKVELKKNAPSSLLAAAAAQARVMSNGPEGRLSLAGHGRLQARPVGDGSDLT